MTRLDPLPFRLKLPAEDTLDLRGARSVSYRLEGLLHVERDVLTLEWVATRWTQALSFSEVKDVVDESPLAVVEIPLKAISRAALRGRWWAPRLELRAREFGAFDGIPGASPGTVSLGVRRQDRAHAAAVAAAIMAANDDTADGR